MTPAPSMKWFSGKWSLGSLSPIIKNNEPFTPKMPTWVHRRTHVETRVLFSAHWTWHVAPAQNSTSVMTWGRTCSSSVMCPCPKPKSRMHSRLRGPIKFEGNWKKHLKLKTLLLKYPSISHEASGNFDFGLKTKGRCLYRNWKFVYWLLLLKAVLKTAIFSLE